MLIFSAVLFIFGLENLSSSDTTNNKNTKNSRTEVKLQMLYNCCCYQDIQAFPSCIQSLIIKWTLTQLPLNHVSKYISSFVIFIYCVCFLRYSVDPNYWAAVHFFYDISEKMRRMTKKFTIMTLSSTSLGIAMLRVFL